MNLWNIIFVSYFDQEYLTENPFPKKWSAWSWVNNKSSSCRPKRTLKVLFICYVTASNAQNKAESSSVSNGTIDFIIFGKTKPLCDSILESTWKFLYRCFNSFDHSLHVSYLKGDFLHIITSWKSSSSINLTSVYLKYF